MKAKTSAVAHNISQIAAEPAPAAAISASPEHTLGTALVSALTPLMQASIVDLNLQLSGLGTTVSRLETDITKVYDHLDEHERLMIESIERTESRLVERDQSLRAACDHAVEAAKKSLLGDITQLRKSLGNDGKALSDSLALLRSDLQTSLAQLAASFHDNMQQVQLRIQSGLNQESTMRAQDICQISVSQAELSQRIVMAMEEHTESYRLLKARIERLEQRAGSAVVMRLVNHVRAAVATVAGTFSTLIVRFRGQKTA